MTTCLAYCSVCVRLWLGSKFRTKTTGFIAVITGLWLTSHGSEFAEWPGTGHAVGAGVTTVTTCEQAVLAMATTDSTATTLTSALPTKPPSR